MQDRPKFNTQFLVGIEQIDREHQRLFEIAGHVHDALAENTAEALRTARTAIAELLDYTATHFANEEALMEAAGFPGLETHRELHRHLISHARDMEMRIEFDEQYVPLELSVFLCNWLVDHIQESDRKFGDFKTAQA